MLSYTLFYRIPFDCLLNVKRTPFPIIRRFRTQRTSFFSTVRRLIYYDPRFYGMRSAVYQLTVPVERLLVSKQKNVIYTFYSRINRRVILSAEIEIFPRFV